MPTSDPSAPSPSLKPRPSSTSTSTSGSGPGPESKPEPKPKPIDASSPSIHVQYLGCCEYLDTWQRMKTFTDTRDDNAQDQLWLLEHSPVFTQGLAGKPEHVLADAGDIPIVASDRGGQVTYHGPGQLVVYPLISLRRLNLGVRELVTRIENSVVTLLAEYGIEAAAKADAPGVYVDGAKIASLGLRVRRGCSFHGVAINFNMDLSPFNLINPCGFPGLEMRQVCDLLDDEKQPTFESFQRKYAMILALELGFDKEHIIE
ncbi:MAG: lipoyl(octanoyl) transferase [Flavobacteriales bacterium]|jgi:lipoyl(octanoyl) transferase